MKSYLPDILIIVGLAGIGYGLFLYHPWISFVAVGAILLSFGVLGYIGKK